MVRTVGVAARLGLCGLAGILLSCSDAGGSVAGALRAGSVVVTPLRPAAQLDLAEVQERTRRFEEARERQALLHGERAFVASSLDDALGGAVAAAGPRPTALGRLAFPRSEGAEASELPRAEQRRLEALAASVAADARTAERYLAALERSWDGLEAERAVRDGAIAQRGLLASREQRALELLDRISSGFGLRAGGFGARLRLWGRQLVGRDPASALEELQGELARWGAVRTPVLGAELTYVAGALRSSALPATTSAPAYAAAQGSFALEDTSDGQEVELSPEIRAKAAELGTAKAAYEFVKNGTRLDWYFGSLKGSTEALRSLRGNDADLSALLIALLRAQGTPARYVRGTIELPVERIAELLGLLEGAEAEAVYAGQPLSPEVRSQARDRVLTAVPALGIPFEPVASGGGVAAVRLLHTWVEAYVPYASYRGVGTDPSGRQWIPLDPALGGGVRHAARTPDFDAYAEAGLSAAALVRDYLGDSSNEGPLDLLRRRVVAHLDTAHPGTGWTAALREVEQRPEAMPYLPGTLPFPVAAVHEEHAFLPDSAKHRLRLVAVDPAGATLLDVTVPLHQLVGHRTLFTYRPATMEDEQVVAAAGGLYQAPAGAVRLLPVLRVDGTERAAGARSVGLGEQHEWTLEMLLPDGSSRRVVNKVIAGNAVAIGLGAPGNAFVEGGNANSSAPDLDGPALQFLYGRAAAYASRWTRDEEELAKLLRVVPLRPTANLVLVSNQLGVDEALGVRRGVVWKGLEVDADYRSMTPLELVPGRARELLRLAGYQGSFLEAQVLAEGTGEDSISAVQVIQQARAQGVPVLELTPANAAAELPGLSAPPDVLRDVADQLAQGREVLVPTAPISVRDWTGTGFVARDPRTEEGGYFLSGHVSGGQTIVSPFGWLDQALVERLERPDAPRSTADLSLIARIVKVRATDMQRGLVGTRLGKPLTVVVTTLQGVPVRGAPVTFRSNAESRPLFLDPGGPAGAGPMETLQVATDEAGRARAIAIPDTNIRRHAIGEQGTPNLQLVGLEEITAETSNGGTRIVLADPFFAVGLPGAAARMTLSGPAELFAPLGVVCGEDLVATVTDEWGNPLANQAVTWSERPGTGRFLDPALRSRQRVDVLDPGDPAQVPVLRQTSSTLGTVVMAYVNGGSATVTAASGAARASYQVTPSGDASFMMAWVPSGKGRYDGLQGTSFPAPYVFEILARNRASGAAWVPLTGEEANLSEVSVRMSVSDAFIEYEHVLQVPPQPVAGEAAAFDTPRNVVFWPRYIVPDGDETLTFTGTVRLDDGRQPCCSVPFTFTQRSSRVVVGTERVLAGRMREAIPPGGSAQDTDEAVSFSIPNPGASPLYVRIIEDPVLVGYPLVGRPPIVMRAAPYPLDLVELLPYTTTDLELPIVPGTVGGHVSVEVLAPDPAEGPETLASVATASVLIARDGWLEIAVPADNPRPDETPAVPYVSFLARQDAGGMAIGDELHAQVRAGPGLAEHLLAWEVTTPLGQVVDQGPRAGSASFDFVPSPWPHPKYGRINGTVSRPAALSYAIRVTETLLGVTHTHTVTQDQRDVIRQQYANHGISIPERAEFTPAATSAYWGTTLRNPEYGFVVGNPEPLADSILTEYRRLANDAQLAPFGASVGADEAVIRGPEGIITPDGSVDLPPSTRPCWDGAAVTACDDHVVGNQILAGPDGTVQTRVRYRAYNLLVTSAWRSPEHNEAVGGVKSSRHQYADALDLVPVGIRPTDEYTTWCLLLTAAERVSRSGTTTFAQAESGPATETKCNSVSSPTDHVHMELKRP